MANKENKGRRVSRVKRENKVSPVKKEILAVTDRTVWTDKVAGMELTAKMVKTVPRVLGFPIFTLMRMAISSFL